MAKPSRPRATWLSQPKPRRGRPPREMDLADYPNLVRNRARYNLMRELLSEISYGTSEAKLYAGLLAEVLMASNPKLESRFRFHLTQIKRHGPSFRSVVED